MSTISEELRKRVAALTTEERREAPRHEAERREAERKEGDRFAAAHRANDERRAAYKDELTATTSILHTRAMGILNVKSLVPVTLDLVSS